MTTAASTQPAAQALAKAVAALAAGQLVVIPTDTVYGLAAQPDLPAAVNAVFAAKARPRALPLPVLVANSTQAQQLAQLNQAAQVLMHVFWPGALTLVAVRQPHLDWDLGQADGTIALRQPDHPIALALLEMAGPLAVTSANLSGQPPALDAASARQQLGDTVAVVLDAGPSPGEIPSTVVSLSQDGDLTVLREGAISRFDIDRCLDSWGQKQ